MIKTIELTNFENHKHTVIKDISNQFTLICGESNSGKTSIVRALKLIAYNDFNPKSVRVGTEACEVYVETDLGSVRVKRGKKDNTWTVKKNGHPEEIFEKVGKVILPHAAEIIGMDVAKLGDIDIPVNIMDQLEGHFMLSELNGKNASGSMRAQVIDEISGLSGIEALIKEVSLDKSRNLKAIKKLETENEELNEELYDQTELEKEEKELTFVNSLVEKFDKNYKKVESIEEMLDEFLLVDSKRNKIELCISKFDGIDLAQMKTEEAIKNINVLKEIEKFQGNIEGYLDKVIELDNKLSKTPDTKNVKNLVAKIENNLNDIQKMNNLVEEYNKIEKRKRVIKTRLGQVPNFPRALVFWGKAETNTKSVIEADEILDEAIGLKEKMEVIDKKVLELGKKIVDLKKEEKELLKKITVCPLTLKPISGGCLKGISK